MPLLCAASLTKSLIIFFFSEFAECYENLSIKEYFNFNLKKKLDVFLCRFYVCFHKNTMQKKDSFFEDKLFLFVLVLLKTSATPFVCIFVPMKKFLKFSQFVECCEVYGRKKNTFIHSAGQVVVSVRMRACIIQPCTIGRFSEAGLLE